MLSASHVAATALLHHFNAAAIRYFGVSGGQRKKFARALPSAHIDGNRRCTGVPIFGDAKTFCPKVILFFPINQRWATTTLKIVSVPLSLFAEYNSSATPPVTEQK